MVLNSLSLYRRSKRLNLNIFFIKFTIFSQDNQFSQAALEHYYSYSPELFNYSFVLFFLQPLCLQLLFLSLKFSISPLSTKTIFLPSY